VGVQVVEAELAHGCAGFDCGTADVGEQHGAGVIEQGSGHLRLVLKHVKADREDLTGLERVYESGFIDDTAAGDVDEGARGAEGGEHRCIDKVMGSGTTGAGEDEEVRR
jgi:hypothetical protein